MKKVVSRRSTNGRWGLDIVVADDAVKIPMDDGIAVRGSIVSLGTLSGMRTYEFFDSVDSDDGQMFLLTGEVDTVNGAEVVEYVSLQSSGTATLLVLSDLAVMRHVGYKGRSGEFALYDKGVRKDIPQAVLASMGLIVTDQEVVIVDPPKISSAIADAARAAGLI